MKIPYKHLYEQIEAIKDKDDLPRIILVTGRDFTRNQLVTYMLKDFDDFHCFSDNCIENNRHYSEYPEIILGLKKLSEETKKTVVCLTQSLELIKEAAKLEGAWMIRLDSTGSGYYDAILYNDFGMKAIESVDYEVRG